jgi:hypothetical protein
MTLLTGWPLEISVDDILRGQAVDPQVVRAGKPALLRAAERVYKESLELLHPAAITREIGIRAIRHEQVVLENGLKLTGPLAARHLAGAQRLVAAACTIGPQLEQAVSAALASNPLHALALDGLGNAAVEMLSQQICAHLGEDLHLEEYTASTPLSPGSPDWPVEIGQPQIFALLDGSQAGISLTASSMMLPKKSVSFVVGIGHGMAQTNLCTICSLKDTCRYQHV